MDARAKSQAMECNGGCEPTVNEQRDHSLLPTEGQQDYGHRGSMSAFSCQTDLIICHGQWQWKSLVDFVLVQVVSRVTRAPAIIMPSVLGECVLCGNAMQMGCDFCRGQVQKLQNMWVLCHRGGGCRNCLGASERPRQQEPRFPGNVMH